MMDERGVQQWRTYSQDLKSVQLCDAKLFFDLTSIVNTNIFT